MTTFAQRRADQEARERAHPIGSAPLISIGTRSASMTSGGRATSVEVDQLVDRKTMRLAAHLRGRHRGVRRPPASRSRSPSRWA